MSRVAAEGVFWWVETGVGSEEAPACLNIQSVSRGAYRSRAWYAGLDVKDVFFNIHCFSRDLNPVPYNSELSDMSIEEQVQ